MRRILLKIAHVRLRSIVEVGVPSNMCVCKQLLFARCWCWCCGIERCRDRVGACIEIDDGIVPGSPAVVRQETCVANTGDNSSQHSREVCLDTRESMS